MNKRLFGVLVPFVFLCACSGHHGSNGGPLPFARGAPGAPRHTMSGGGGIAIANTYANQSGGAVQYLDVSLSPAPSQGDTEIAVVYAYNGGSTCYTVTPPSGWSGPYDSTCSGRNAIWTFSGTAGSSDSSYRFKLPTSSDTDYFSIVVYDVTGADASSPIDSHHGSQAFTANATTQNTLSETPSRSGDYAIASFATGYKALSSVGTPFHIDKNANAGVYLSTAGDAMASPVATSATGTYASPGPASGISNLLFVQPPLATPPPSHIKTYAYYDEFNQNTNTSEPSTQNWLNFCEGSGSTTPQTNCTSPVHLLVYFNAAQMDVCFNSVCGENPYDSDMPWAGGQTGTSCPAAAKDYPNGRDLSGGNANFGHTGYGDETWFEHAAGSPSATAAYRIVSDYGQNTDQYLWELNKGSTSALAYQNNVLDNCTGAHGEVWNSYWGVRADQSPINMSEGVADFGVDASGLYAPVYTGMNIGMGTGGSYYSGSCADPYSSPPCIQTAGPLTSNYKATYECTTDTCYNDAMASMYDGWRHANSSPFSTMYNGLLNTDFSVLNASPNIVGGIAEKQITDTGGFTYQSDMARIIDIGATLAATDSTKYFVVENTNKTGDTPGTAFWEQSQRVIHGVEWLAFYDNLVDWDYYSSGSTNTEVYPIDFVYPTQPDQTAAAASATSGAVTPCGFGTASACAYGGAHDSAICVAGTAPNCVYRREFAHCYIQTNFATTASGIDEGPCAVLVNLETSSQTIQSTWLTRTYQSVMALCSPGASYTVACSSAASGGDVGGTGVGNGPGTVNCSIAASSVTSVPSNDAVFYWSKRSPSCT